MPTNYLNRRKMDHASEALVLDDVVKHLDRGRLFDF